MAIYPQAGWSPAGQTSGSTDPRQAIYTGSGSPVYGPVNPNSSTLGVSSQAPVYGPPTPAPVYGPPTPTSAPSSGSQSAPVYGPPTPTGPSNDAFSQAISDAYGPSYNYLDQAEGAVRNDYPSALSAAQANYNDSASQLGNSRQGAFDTLSGQQTQATHGKEDAMSAARRQFQEQQIGANQRFGGSSSAGQALSELQSRSLAEQQGKTQRQYTDVSHNIDVQRNQIEHEYQTNLQMLGTQKQTAIDNATRDFNNKLLQISQNRAQLGQAKADANLQALQNLRNQVFAINQQNTQFQQQLELQRNQAHLQLGNYSTAVQGYTNASGQAAANPYATMNNNYAVGNAQSNSTQAPASPYVGAISSPGTKQNDLFSNPLLQGIVGGVTGGAASAINPLLGLGYQAYNSLNQ